MKPIDLLDTARLDRLSDFERLKFIPWVEWMAEAASLLPEDILSILHYATVEPLVLDFIPGESRSYSYRRWGRFLGHTPLEMSEQMFTADHWHAHKPIPDRDIIWNPEWGGKRAETFKSTHKYLQTFR